MLELSPEGKVQQESIANAQKWMQEKAAEFQAKGELTEDKLLTLTREALDRFPSLSMAQLYDLRGPIQSLTSEEALQLITDIDARIQAGQ